MFGDEANIKPFLSLKGGNGKKRLIFGLFWLEMFIFMFYNVYREIILVKSRVC